MSKKNVYSNTLNVREKTRQAKVATPQTSPIPGTNQVANSAGGFSFAVDIWTHLDRFLILGSEGGSYYATERKLSLENAKNILACIKADGARTVNRIVEISDAGRAPKNDPALFALALVMTHGDKEAQSAAFDAIPAVARIGTHILHLADYVNGMRSWGRGVRRGFANWYNSKTPLQVANQLVKYANRDGWTHADILKLAHVKPATPTHEALFADALGKVKENADIDLDVAEFMSAVEEVKKATSAKRVAQLVSEHRLPREVIPTQFLKEQIVWEALLPHMGMEAMIRNLATMTRVGIIAPLSNGTKDILAKMANEEAVKKSRLHPIKVLAALLTYTAGRSARGDNTWTPVNQINAALDDLFYATFQNIIPTGKRILVCLDVSGSMTGGEVTGVPGLSPRVASAALAMMTMRTEKQYDVVGFTSSRNGYFRRSGGINDISGLSRVAINARMTLNEVCNHVDGLPFGGTDCSLPCEWARVNKIDVDGFLVYTDSETYAGARHPSQALAAYRQASGNAAKLCVVGMVSNGFSIADPKDAGMLDVVGFDTATPSLMSDFVRGDF